MAAKGHEKIQETEFYCREAAIALLRRAWIIGVHLSGCAKQKWRYLPLDTVIQRYTA